FYIAVSRSFFERRFLDSLPLALYIRLTASFELSLRLTWHLNFMVRPKHSFDLIAKSGRS
ncbi:hypothetical protein BpHYR1_015759, partial [Brachionus plicatilis]